MPLKMYNTLVFSVLCATALGHLVDRTLEPKSHGRDVVGTVINRINRSGVFPDDRDFLRRVAYVESKFGDDPTTYRDGYFGGVWQFDQLEKTQHDESDGGISQELKDIHAGIKEELGIDWLQVKKEDLLKPLYSGLAARINLEQTQQSHGQIPADLDGQAKYWKDNYTSSQNQENDFQTKVRKLLKDDMQPSSARIDLMMVMTGSSRIDNLNFKKGLDTLTRLAGVFDRREANIGMLSYGGEDAFVEVPLVNDYSMERIQQRIRNAIYPATWTNAYVGMKEGIAQFKALPAERKESGVPRLMVVFADGDSHGYIGPNTAAENAAKIGITTFGFGIQNVWYILTDKELLKIANNKPENVIRANTFDDFSEQISRFVLRAKSMPQSPKMGSETKETMKRVGETRNYKIKVPANGATVILTKGKGDIRGYWINSAEQPSSALYDGILKEGKTFIPPQQNADGDVLIALESLAADSSARIKIVEGRS
nr:PREDICTED: uncharacterized protein LOC109040225 [Bemisia tabaci]